MSTQRVVSHRFPYLPVHLEIGHQRYEFDALLDTGFDGSMAVPPDLIADDLMPNGQSRWVLADGSSILARFWAGSLRIGMIGPFPVAVSAFGHAALIGRGVTDRLTIILDHGQQIIAEP